MTLVGRSGSRHSAQGSVVSRLPQLEHCLRAAAALARASASGSSRVSRFFSSANAARRAERGPSPGSLASNWMRRSISCPAGEPATNASIRIRRARAEALQQILDEFGILKAPRFQFHLAVGTGRNDQIFQDSVVLRLQQRRIDRQALELAQTVQRRAHQAAAGNTFCLHLGETLLQLIGAALHLLHLTHEVGIHQFDSSSETTGGSSSRSRTATISAPGNASSTARTNGSWDTASFLARSAARRCSARVGAPPSEASVTIQRSPVQSRRRWARSLARVFGAWALGRNSMRPRSSETRCTLDSNCVANRRAPLSLARATISSRLRNSIEGADAIGAGATMSLRRGAGSSEARVVICVRGSGPLP